ncbi:hypothetical protein CHLNCDRAFT_137152 [Chlorella variabilis]|uniref:Sfi1 spindle body domain-containing protein n=1 Tax=Chlorella variabilis TaxID=554065 RepID=E1ZLC7_CHLVA|nr:hypothetical protein CHLNCDRAFT_137152 [Chlorella variabilis]EFN53243.1 hypothetical protein CHLNCDRAFT_137152 [Chlorella variabilis]|eukprot:XP_005845345.1 hypothetical protein CHLNCDRAFT_137152 [Chlorella variabilis]
MTAEALAGLAYSFQPLSLQPARGRAVERGAEPQPRPRSSGSGSDRGSGGPARSVAFNLKERRPGPAYNSPEGSEAGSGNQQTSPGAANAADDSASASSRPAGLAHLKLASLRRRAMAGSGAAASALPHSLPAAATAEGVVPAAQDAEARAARPAPDDTAASRGAPAAAVPAAAEAEQQAALLRGVESALAGCGSQVLQEPPPAVALPHHVLVGMRVLATPPPAPGPAAAGSSGTHQATSEHEGFQIAAYRPVASVNAEPAAGGDSAALEPAEAACDASTAACSSQQQPPATLQAALCYLGLLASPRQQNSVGSLVASSSSQGSSGSDCQLQWVQLRAVQLVVAAKRAAAVDSKLLPLVRRLRQLRMLLAFHQTNLQRGRSRSPRGSSSSSPRPPPGPWLSGRSSSLDSKHRSSRSSSPGAQLQPRPKVAWPSPEASELQMQLLGSLRQKLLLKLGLAVLRQEVAAGRLRQRLLGHVAASAAADLCHSALLGWHAAAVPTQQQEAAAQGLARQLRQRRQRAQLTAWRRSAARSAWRRRQLARGQMALRRHLLAAGVQHWRCYCQQQLVRRLQEALAARWLAAWGRRRVFAAWRRTASRSALLKSALLSPQMPRVGSGADCSGGAGQRPQLPSQLEALAVTAAAFQPIKDFVAEAVQQLGQLCKGLRFAAAGSRSMAAAGWHGGLEGWARQQQHLGASMGSVEALLALVPPPRQQQQAPALPGLPANVTEQPLAADGSATRMQLPSLAVGAQHNPQEHHRGAAGHAGRARRSAAVAADAPAGVGAELVECQERVQRPQQQLAELEQATRGRGFGLESEGLQHQCRQLEQAAQAAQQAAGSQRQACAAADAAKEAAAAAMQAAAQEHAAAAAGCDAQERQVQQQQGDCQEAAAAAAGARAALNAAAELQALSGMGVQRWSKAVEGIAKELAACHRTQQAPVMVRLKEARQRLERHRQEAAAAEEQLPQLQAAAQEAEQRAERARRALAEAQQRLVAAAERRACLQQQLNAAMGRHEAAAVAAVAAAQEASATEQQQRLLAAQQQAAAGRLRQAAQQVMRKQEEAVQLQAQVQQLQQRHRDAVAAALAAAPQQRRGALKRRLHAVQQQEQGSTALPSPPPVQQRRPPPAAATAVAAGSQPGGLGGAGSCSPLVPAAAAAAPGGSRGVQAPAAGPLVLCLPPSGWSCSSSSELGSPEADAVPPPPLTVDEAAARFSARCLLRRGLAVLRQEAAATRSAMLAVEDSWRRRRLKAVLHVWHSHAADAAAWLAAASAALRRRWLLRRWRAAASGHRWLRQAEAAADGCARRRLLGHGMRAWRQHVRHERWRDALHEQVMQLRLRGVLQGWRGWARTRRQKAARLRAALAVYHRRLLEAAVRQWRWVQHSRALLYRVFSTAVGLWQEEVGARLHQHNYQLAEACWRAWQLHVLQAQEQRRQAMLGYAAEAHRERRMQAAGLAAFRQAVADACEGRRLARLLAKALVEWRRLAATSDRHWDYEAARDQRRALLLRCSLAAWRAAAEDTAGLLARFWLRWQVQAPLRRVLLAWRAAATAAHQDRVLGSAAEVHRERRLQQQGLAAFAAQAASSRARSSAGAGASSLHSILQQPARRQPASKRQLGTAVAGPGTRPREREGGECSGCGGGGFTATILISQGHCNAELPATAQQQEQVAPGAAAAASHVTAADGSRCLAAQGVGSGGTDWRAAASYWRQRHASYSLQQQPGLSTASGGQQQQQQQPVCVHPGTVAALAELRAEWRQQ